MGKGLASLDKVISNVLAEEEFQDCFLIEWKEENNKVEVFIDADEGVNFTKCRLISRKIEAYLDETQLLGENYKLEISSPGAAAPLKLLRQYPKHIGRKIKVILSEGHEYEGKLTAVEDTIIKIDVMDGKKIKEKRNIEFNEIKESFILLAF